MKNTSILILILCVCGSGCQNKNTNNDSVKVYDGETIVFGGRLGDSEEEVSDAKCGLKIYTTPRLVNPDGSPLKNRKYKEENPNK